ncbi:uncharacterized protein LOC135840014 [Planococcus citri]|uniref:uncharacterized protein LOC135840014 n=1 Tax=Planococcus citri TaxID=170843 RepID=UPI0031F80728
MPKGYLRPILKSRTRILSQVQSEASTEHNREKENQMSSPIIEEKELDRPRIKRTDSKRKPFTCRVAVFEEDGDANKKPMYPKHLVYAGGKDIQLEEIRSMHYWNKVKGAGIDKCTQTEPEPMKVIPMTETCTQTESESSSTSVKEIAIQTDPPESNEQPNHNSPKVFTSRVTTRSSARARAASKIPAATSALKNVIKEEPPAPALNSATFIIPKDKKQTAANSKKGAQVQVAEKLLTAEHSDEDADEDDDLTYSTKAFKVIPSSTPSSTPFQVLKNKNKGRRKTTKIDTP